MDVDAFPDASSLALEFYSGNSETLDRGHDERLQEVCEGGCPFGIMAAPYFEFLDVWQEGCGWGDGGQTIAHLNADLLEQVRPRVGGPPLGYQGARVKCVAYADTTVGVPEDVSEFVNHLVDKV